MTLQRNKPLVNELQFIKLNSICSRKIQDYIKIHFRPFSSIIDWTESYRMDLKYNELTCQFHESILPHKTLISYSICHFIISFILIPGCLCCLFRCLWRPYLVLIVNPQYLHLYILFKCFASIWRVRSFRLQACWPHPLHQYVPMLFRVI